MINRIYYTDPACTEFDAVVAGALEHDGRPAVELDRTAFYPTSGGQPYDTGRLGDVDVVDVLEDDDGAVIHVLSAALPQGARVAGRVDWQRRFDHMQQHTGQHVLSRAFIQTASLPTVSFHMGDEACTIDLEGGGFDENAAKRAEDLANRIIEENRPIDIRSVPLAELDQLELRRKVPEGVTIARIVSVRDFDAIPCCGTHVRSTGELGLVKVLRAERVKQLNRVHFKVGQRALDDYREKHAIVQSLANRLTTSPADLMAKIERMTDESQAAGKQAKRLIQRLAEVQAGALLHAAARVGDRRVVVHRENDAALARALGSVLQNEPGTVALVGADDGTVVCAAARDVTIDLATVASATARELGGSGGGKGGFAQLKLPDGSRVDELLQRMHAYVAQQLS